MPTYEPRTRLPSEERLPAPAQGTANSPLEAATVPLERVHSDGVPSLDEVLWEGVEEEHDALYAEIAVTTCDAIELQPRLPPDAGAELDGCIDEVFSLEEALAAAMNAAQGASAYDDEGEPQVPEAPVVAVERLWDRLELALELTDATTDLFSALLLADLASAWEEGLSRWDEFATSGIEAELRERAAESERAAHAYSEALAGIQKNTLKLPSDLIVDAAVTAGFQAVAGSAAVGMVAATPIGAAAVAATVFVGSLAIGAAWSDLWGPTGDGIVGEAGQIGARIDAFSRSMSIPQASASVQKAGAALGNASTTLTVLVDLSEIAGSIGQLRESIAALDAYREAHERLERTWEVFAFLHHLVDGAVRQLRGVILAVATELPPRQQRVHALRALLATTEA